MTSRRIKRSLKSILGTGLLFFVALFKVCGADCPKPCNIPPEADTVSAWVTGAKFAWGANCDRTTKIPKVIARFRDAQGQIREYDIIDLSWPGRHFVHRKLSAAERREVAGGVFEGVFARGLTEEDVGFKVEEARFYAEGLPKIAVVSRPRRNLKLLKGQTPGFNTGDGVLPFPTREMTVVPEAAASRPVGALAPMFNGGALEPEEACALQVTSNRVGRTLILDFYADAGKVTAVTLGTACEAAKIKAYRIPYLAFTDRSDKAPPLLDVLEGGWFRLAFFDWYRSNASKIEVVECNGEKVLVARYLPKTDGTYNPVCERVVVALSDKVEDVFPEIPNPPSIYKNMSGSRVWRTHAAFDRKHDRELWRMVYEHGIRKVTILDHETMWRDRAEAFTQVTEAAKGRGGDEEQRRYSCFLNEELGYFYGPYNNYTDMQSCNAAYWSVDRVNRLPDGSLQQTWLRSYAPKPSCILPLCERIVPEIQSKFAFRGAYCDVHSAYRPWSYTDYDARIPGAATYSQTFYAYGELFLLQKRLWGGPVWSEGGSHFMYAGLVDGNYAQDARCDFSKDPWIVDFDLLKIHPLETDFGMGCLSMFAPGKTKYEEIFYIPSMEQGRETLLNRFIAATLAFGHAGYLVLDWCWDPPKMYGPAYCGKGSPCFRQGMAVAMKSYFMTQAIAARYTKQIVERIRYFDADGKALTTSEALLTGAVSANQLAVDYSGGTHVVVNGNGGKRLKAMVGGVAIDLPPYGYRAWTDDGTVLVESGDSGGCGRRTDFAKAPDYVFKGIPEGVSEATFKERDGTWRKVSVK